MALFLIIGSLLAAPADAVRPDPQDLARQIDRRLAEHFETERVTPAERGDDAEFLRRICLDLVGRIPTPAEVREFLAHERPEKCSLLIDRLIDDPRHARHFARVWRALLLPEAETDRQIRYLQPGLEAWLEERRGENAGFDKIVRELLTVPIAAPGETPQFVLREMRKPNPLAFFAAKSAEPEKIASSSFRLFLGLRLECAQCHDHPFDRWTRQQFWNQAAFFAGIERRGNGVFAPLVEAPDRRAISMTNASTGIPALYLDLSQPQFGEGQSSRGNLAEWMTSPRNPYFARATVNRVWAQLMGTGLVDPIDDFRDTNPPSHPELLAELTDAFREAGFDLSFLLRALCRTDAYQRTSRQTHPSQTRPEVFARMAIKPLSGDQFFDSLAEAIEYTPTERENGFDEEEDPLRRRVQTLFTQSDQSGEPESSIAQTLALMNGPIVQRAVAPDTGRRLKTTLEDFPDAPEKQVEALYLATVSRLPTPAERDVLRDFYESTEPAARPRRLGDIFWALLNSAEFRWNH